MPKPLIHAKADVRRWGGAVRDYLPLHDLLDSSKATIPSPVHRALTHTSWFFFIMERIFGDYIVNSDGKEVSVRDICEQHVLHDFKYKFIPTPQDYLENMEIKDWMNNGLGYPPSAKKVQERRNCD